MATLVLTVVGTVFGGPIGAAIGATLGNVIDRTVLFAPKGRQGPRLSDLRLQTSSYGTQVPQIFGSMRVAGSVIWATDLREHRHRHDGGKGQPDVTTYSYTASLAVALSSRPITEVRRIWADGNLLRGAAGDFKSGIGRFRVALGSEDQGVDAHIAATMGTTRTSAHRGMAYAVFEHLQLADFGNRIPSLTFEVVADSGEVFIADIAAALSRGALTGEPGGGRLTGYAASGPSVADALAPLVEGHDLALRAQGNEMMLVAGEGTALAVPMDQMVRRANGRARDALSHKRERADRVPLRLTLRHYDPARDYNAGAQSAWRAGAGTGESSVDLPAAASAATMRTLAEARLHGLWAGRSQIELRCDWRALLLVPGDVVTLAGWGGRWRIEQSEWEAMAVTLKLRALPGGAPGALPADAGEGVAQADIEHGPSIIVAVDLPPLGEASVSVPQVAVGAAGASPAWRRAALYIEDDAGGLAAAGNTAAPATLGKLVTAMSAGPSLMADMVSAPVVELAGDHMTLVGADDAALAQGANAAMIGNELVQFGDVQQIGPRQYRLGRLWRGRRGTEGAIAAHAGDTPFLLLEAEQLAVLQAVQPPVGALVRVRAIGLGDLEPAEAQCTALGRAMLPAAPVHGTVATLSGDRHLAWVRRSRAGWRWQDGADVPLTEEREAYQVTLMQAGAAFRTVEVAAPMWIYGATAAGADIAAGHAGLVTAEIRQIGTYGASAPLTLSFLLS